jgi:valyl-tRNA synthetase
VEKFLTVATTEIETIAGDGALLVSGDDERYQEVLGKNVLNPLTEEPIPVIPDGRVDLLEGTGVLRLTPGRRREDFQKARASGIEPPPLFDRTGKLEEGAGPVMGLDSSGANKVVREVLEARGFIDRSEEGITEQAVCCHCEGPVYPLMNEHWYLRMHILAERAAAAVRAGMVRFQPARWEKTFLAWADSAHPWRISVGKGFGHRIGVDYCTGCGTPAISPPPGGGCRKCGGSDFREGEEVLDPWFSSVVGSLSALGWPQGPSNAVNLPISLVVARQGNFHDWLVRFLAVGSALTGRQVFRLASIHGRIAGEGAGADDGREGKAIDPRDIIRPNGADAVRLGLAELPFEFHDIHMSPERFDAGRNFVNKLWNAARFASMHIKQQVGAEEIYEPSGEDRWILGRLDATVAEVTRALSDMNPGDAAERVVEFVRHDLSAWYLEMAKMRIRAGNGADAARRTLGRVIFTLLRILQPMMPFVTEAIWRRFLSAARSQGRNYPLLWAPWPTGGKFEADAELEEKVDLLKRVVRAVRSIRMKYKLPRKDPVSVAVSFLDRAGRDGLTGFEDLLKGLVNAQDVSFGIHLTKPSSCATEVQGSFQVFIPLLEPARGLEEIRRLRKRQARLEDRLIAVARPLESREFLQKAPREVRDTLVRKRELLVAQLLHLRENIRELTNLLEPSVQGTP